MLDQNMLSVNRGPVLPQNQIYVISFYLYNNSGFVDLSFTALSYLQALSVSLKSGHFGNTGSFSLQLPSILLRTFIMI